MEAVSSGVASGLAEQHGYGAAQTTLAAYLAGMAAHTAAQASQAPQAPQTYTGCFHPAGRAVGQAEPGQAGPLSAEPAYLFDDSSWFERTAIRGTLERGR